MWPSAASYERRICDLKPTNLSVYTTSQADDFISPGGCNYSAQLRLMRAAARLTVKNRGQRGSHLTRFDQSSLESAPRGPADFTGSSQRRYKSTGQGDSRQVQL